MVTFRSILNAKRTHQGLDELNPVEFMKLAREALKLSN